MEYYSATNRNEILPFVATWMDWKDIMLSEIRGGMWEGGSRRTYG